jgi:hypothetical protein
MTFKYGKKPARPGAIKLKLSTYLKASSLPTPPANFGHGGLVSSYGMLGNDRYGDCVWAGAAHETMLWAKEGGTTAGFTTTDVLEDYAAATGFNPNDPSTDQGTDLLQSAEYRRTVGVRDNLGNRHKIAAYLQIQSDNLQELAVAAYLFGAVGIGWQIPNTAQPQFQAGQPWDVVEGAYTVGGHYTPLIGRQNGLFRVITWGKIQNVTTNFFNCYSDEAVAYVSEEMLTNGVSPEGFDLAALQADLAQLQTP